jgi:hypothetical protein
MEGVHVFLASDLMAGESNREETDQDMRQQWFPQSDVERMLRDGAITEGPSLAAYLLLTLRKYAVQRATAWKSATYARNPAHLQLRAEAGPAIHHRAEATTPRRTQVRMRGVVEKP